MYSIISKHIHEKGEPISKLGSHFCEVFRNLARIYVSVKFLFLGLGDVGYVKSHYPLDPSGTLLDSY